MNPLLGGSLERLKFSYANRELGLVIERRGPVNGPLWLLLPALSTVSSRGEWSNFANSIDPKFHLVSFDWPGFGDSDRPKINYNNGFLQLALSEVLKYLKQFNQEKITIVAAGHSACVALGLASDYSEQWQKLILVAPTWRGPLPTMTGWRPKHFSWLRQLVSLPIVGSILYYLNTSRVVLRFMLRRHVWVNANLLRSERISEQQKLSRRTDARFASVAFVSGGFDPAEHRSWWFGQVKRLGCPMHVVLAMEAPPRSKKEMRLLADHAQKITKINGRLGLHQEFGHLLSEQILAT